MSLGDLVASTALGNGRLVGWTEFWDTHACTDEWGSHVQLIAASALYRRPIVVVTSVGEQTVAALGVDPAAKPLYVVFSMASVVMPGRTESLAAHHYEGLFVVEVSPIDPPSV